MHSRATYGVYFHGVHVAVYATFLALLTYCVCTGVNMSLVPHLKKESYENILKHASEGTVFENATEDDWQELKRSDVSPNAAAILIASFAIANMIKEVYQMIRQVSSTFIIFPSVYRRCHIFLEVDVLD